MRRASYGSSLRAATQGAAAAALAVILAFASPAEARDQRSDRPERFLTDQRTIRDEHGFRAGRADRHPDGRTTLRNERGFRTGTIGRDGTIRDERGYRTGRIERDR